MKHDRPPLSPGERFTQGIAERFTVWSSIIDDSGVSDELKDALRKSLARLRDKGLSDWNSLDDAFYGTISVLLTSTESWGKNDQTAMVLFETLRNDLWDYLREIK